MKKGNKIGFNYYALLWLSEHPRLKKLPIHVRMGNKHYPVKTEDILKKKDFLHFKDNGFELQVFYPLKEIVR